MYADPLVITFSGTPTTFNRFQTGGGQGLYVDVASTEDIRQGLRILHSTGAKDKLDPNFIMRRHVFTITRDEYVAAAKRHEVASINVTLSHPNTGTISRAELDRLVGLTTTWLNSSGNIDKWLLNEV